MENNVKGKRKLADFYPQLLEEWDYEKNASICDPRDVSYGSNVIVWWKCKVCGHSWSSRVYTRTSGHGCPMCAKRNVGKRISYGKTKPGINDLASQAPELLEEWSFEKNQNCLPNQIPANSNIKVWWKCKRCGYEWKAMINNRVRGSRCPRCMRHYHTSYPEQAIYYYIHKAFPDAINAYSPEWLGKNMEIDIFIPSLNLGIEYDGEAYHGNSKAEKDRNKSKIIQNHGIRLIRVREPKLEEISDGSDVILTEPPKGDLKYLEKPIQIILSFIGTEYGIDINQSIDLDRDYDSIIQSVSGLISSKSFGHLFPYEARLWNYERNGTLKPTEFLPSSNVKVWWKCDVCNHEWKATIGSIRQGHGCPVCAGKVVNKGVNDFSTLHPDLAEEWSEKNGSSKPEDFLSNSLFRAWWKCKECGTEWQATLNNRVSRNSGCPKCSSKKQGERFRQNRIRERGSLADNNPELLQDWDYEKNKGICDPTEILSGSHTRVWWKCHICQHEWMAAAYSRSSGRGCPVCKKNKLRKKK